MIHRILETPTLKKYRVQEATYLSSPIFDFELPWGADLLLRFASNDVD